MLHNPLPKGWRWTTLEDVQDPNGRAIVSGPFGSNIGSRFFVEAGVPVIRGSNLTTDMSRFLDGGFAFVTEEKAKELAGCHAVAGDLIFTAAGSLGQVGIIPQTAKYATYIISNKQMRARVDPRKVEPLFAFYWFSSPRMVKYIEQRNTGSSVPLINLSILRALPIPLPPLNEQRAILEILDSLDRKIELNRRMNETLEAMARAVFKSWFVDFDPVRAKAERRHPFGMDAETAALLPDSFQDSPFGKIPKGWKAGRLGEIAENPRRGVRPEEVPDETPYIGLEHMPRKSIALATWGRSGEVASNKFRFQQGEILFGKLRPYFHKVGVAVLDGVCSTDILVINARSEEWYGLALGHLSSEEFVGYTDAVSTGTKMPRTNWQDMARYEISLPDPRLAGAFGRFAKTVVGRIRENILQSQTLWAIRDTLLPKLISGEVRIPLPHRPAEVGTL
jgi:type I restriction enzyme, S subunit